MELLGHIFSKDLITFLEAVEKFRPSEVSPPVILSDDTLSLISSSYEATFRIGDKEAASTIPFLVATVRNLRSVTSRNFMVDGEFVVYKGTGRGRNPASDLAIVVRLCVDNTCTQLHIMPNRYKASDLTSCSYIYVNAISTQSKLCSGCIQLPAAFCRSLCPSRL